MLAVTSLPDERWLVAGWYQDPMTLGPASLPIGPGGDAFVAELEAAGVVWADRVGGGDAFDLATEVQPTSDGDLIVAGHFEVSATFGDHLATTAPSDPSGIVSAFFVTRLRADGRW